MATATKTKKGTKHKAAAKSGNGASTLEYLQDAIEDIDTHASTPSRRCARRSTPRWIA